MKAQTPAEGISVTAKFNDATFYRVDCTCGCDEHAIDFEVSVEVEDDVRLISVNTWTIQTTERNDGPLKKRYNIENDLLQNLHWWAIDVVNGCVYRLKLTWQVWTQGYIKYHGSTLMNKQQALNYAETLKTTIKELEKNNGLKN